MTTRARSDAEATARIPAQRGPADPWQEAMAAGKRAGLVAEASPESRVEIAVAAALVVHNDHVQARYRHRLELLVSDHYELWAAIGCSCGHVGHRRRGAWVGHHLLADWQEHLSNVERKP